MKTGFQQYTLDVKTGDGLRDELIEPLGFVRLNGEMLRAPAGGHTDGFSVPRCLQNIVPATGGDWFSAVLHDSAYQGELEICRGVLWRPACYSKKEADDLFLEAMTSQRVGWLMRHLIYLAVRLFGRGNFQVGSRIQGLGSGAEVPRTQTPDPRP